MLIPCVYNVRELPLFLARLEEVCINSDIDLETLILDDASEDGTIAIAKHLQRQYRTLNIRVIHRSKPRRGYGALLRYGLAHATARYCLLVSPYRTHSLDMLPVYLTEARKGAQLVQCAGCGRREDNHKGALLAKYYLAVYRLAARFLVGLDVHDPTCPFKLFDRIYLTAIGIRSNGFGVIPEISFKTWLSGGKIASLMGSEFRGNSDRAQSTVVSEGLAYTYVLLRAWWHRLGFPWF